MNDTPNMQQFRDYIARKVASGAYASEEEAVESVIRTLEAIDLQQTELRHLIEAGLKEVERGEFSPRSVADIVKDVKAKASLQ